jgi:hypothetical protein
MKLRRSLQWLFVCLVCAGPIAAQPARPNDPSLANVSGTVMDSENDVVPGATVVLDGAASQPARTAIADDNGGFHFDSVEPGTPYHVTVNAPGFAPWTSPEITLQPGQFQLLSSVRLVFAAAATSITVYGSPEEIATEEVKLEEQQRVLGIVPNFYVAYDSNAAPLTTKLKFSLALKAETDPVTFLGAALVAGADHAGNTPGYQEGAAGLRAAARRQLYDRIHRHHDRWSDFAFGAASGSAVLLSGHRDDEVARAACAVEPVYLSRG